MKKQSTPTTKTALIYCRVSTKGQEEKTSLHSQADACIKHAQSLGYAIGRITKEVYSGGELWDRPQLARDRADLKAGQFNALICYSTDRLTRDPIHLGIIAEDCERARAELIFVTEPLDSSPEGALIRYVKGYAAQMEREKIKERMMRGRKTKLLQGKPTFHGWDLYGYRANKIEGKYEIHDEEGAIVRLIFNMCAEGNGCHRIASTLNKKGFPSPKGAVVGEGSKWSPGGIHSLLKNSSYKGEEIQWKTQYDRKARKYFVRPEAERIKMPFGIRPAIVSEQVWQAAQDTLSTNRGTYARNHRIPVLLRGLVYCSECGAAMIRNRYKKGKYEYDKYRCGSHWRAFKSECKAKGVPTTTCDDWAWRQAKAILLDPEIVEREVARMENAGPDPQLTTDLESSKRQLARTEKGLQALIRRFRNTADETIWPFIEREIGQAAKEKEQLEATIRDLELRLARRQQKIDGLRSLKEYSERVRQALDTFSFEEKQIAFKALGLKVYANGDNPELWDCEVSIRTEPEGGYVNMSSFAANPG